MELFLQVGLVLGFLAGLAHAVTIYRQRRALGGRDGIYYAAWALALWTLLGAYLLAFWLIGAAGMAVARFRGSVGAAP